MKTLQPAQPGACLETAEGTGPLRPLEDRPVVRVRDHQDVPGMDRRLAGHVDFALAMFARLPEEISGRWRSTS